MTDAYDQLMNHLTRQALKDLGEKVDNILMPNTRRKTDLLETLTTEQAAEQLQVSARTIRRMIERGSINAQKLDPGSKSVYRIPMAEIQRILGERTEPRDQSAGEQ